jgi:hypothetical protein
VRVAAVQQNVEKMRLEALMGPDEKDIAMGRFVGIGEAALILTQKATNAEHHFVA